MKKYEIKTIDVHELKHRMDNSQELCLIDVREQEEWDSVRIPQALHMPKDRIGLTIDDQISDKSNPIYLYCRSGVRSLYAAQSLIEIGYEQVYSIDGGIMEWAVSGYPIHE